MPKALAQFKGDMSNVFKGRNQRHIQMHPRYRGVSKDDLFALLTPQEETFCVVYFQSNCNASQAAFVAFWGGDHTKFKSEKARQQSCSQKGMGTLVLPIVSSYLYVEKRRMMKNQKAKMQRSFDNYRNKTEEIRDLALAAEDFGAALRAHQQLGVVDGHVGENSDDPSRQSDKQIINIIAGGDIKLEQTLAKKLGVKMPDVVDGEVIEES